jgi:hypothetical protein
LTGQSHQLDNLRGQIVLLLVDFQSDGLGHLVDGKPIQEQKAAPETTHEAESLLHAHNYGQNRKSVFHSKRFKP